MHAELSITDFVSDCGICEVPLKQGGFALISAVDKDRVLQLPWRLGTNGYVYCCTRLGLGQKHELLHRFIVDAEQGFDVHHKNEIKTDCRRTNLVVETPRDHQLRHHSHLNRARGQLRRKHPSERLCEWCGVLFVVNPDHRDRNRFCTKTCGNRFTGHQRTIRLASQGAK